LGHPRPKAVSLYAGLGVAAREFPLKAGHCEMDCLLYVNRRAAGVVEAKPVAFTLMGVERPSEQYEKGPPDNLPTGFPLSEFRQARVPISCCSPSATLLYRNSVSQLPASPQKLCRFLTRTGH